MIFPIREQNFPKNIRWQMHVGIFSDSCGWPKRWLSHHGLTGDSQCLPLQQLADGEPQETIYIALETADGSRTLVGSAAKMTEEFSGMIANLKQITRLNGGAQWQ